MNIDGPAKATGLFCRREVEQITVEAIYDPAPRNVTCASCGHTADPEHNSFLEVDGEFYHLSGIFGVRPCTDALNDRVIVSWRSWGPPEIIQRAIDNEVAS